MPTLLRRRCLNYSQIRHASSFDSYEHFPVLLVLFGFEPELHVLAASGTASPVQPYPAVSVALATHRSDHHLIDDKRVLFAS
jgi:hypothetical protein